MMALHPAVEHVVQEQVGQQRTDHPALWCAQRTRLRLTIGQFRRRTQLSLVCLCSARINAGLAAAGVRPCWAHQEKRPWTLSPRACFSQALSWWSRGESNPRPQAIIGQIYMLSSLIWF